MKKSLFITLIVACSCLFTFNIWADIDPNDSCEKPGRVRIVCYTMKQLRAQVLVLDSQRDLVQYNYPLIEKVALSIGQQIQGLVIGGYFDPHMQELVEIKRLTNQLANEASQKNPVTFKTANLVRGKCLQCHTQDLPVSGINWDSMFRRDWDYIVAHCNEPGRNPLVCRQMYGMFSQFSYFSTALNTGNLDFETSEAVATEALRIVRNLLKLGGDIHDGGSAPLREIEKKTQEVIALAKAKDPGLYLKARETSRACMQCH